MEISPLQKKAFIDWFLDQYDLPKREIVWLFDYLLKRDELLNNLHFVFEAHLCPRSMIISVQEGEERPFRFYKEHVVTNEVEKAFHDIRMNHGEPLYVEMNFEGVRNSEEYISVLEDNPFLPDDYYLKDSDYKEIDLLLNYITNEQYILELKSKIDQALDEGDLKSFNFYSSLLNNQQAEDQNRR
ncbi:ReoY family proteolytic degradation factor [Alkalibacillus haloalkaliphilus]|uniref:ReoY family proteolytic degradation factor n=1 Tax=Alkalibacillus haloalkaliphilus TaxID=94136 RepID=UPI00031FC264|nr:ReoY family proteolytic degradation factor [Alkalibacillus haloalkaliphilus]